MVPKLSKKQPEIRGQSPHVFGVPLSQAIQYAGVQTALNCRPEINVYVPIIIERCGTYLRHNRGMHRDGIFRSSGLARRIAELQEIFDSPDKNYGRDLDWTPYTVHDAADVLRRYMTRLPEPVIPHTFYDRFRAPLVEERFLMNGTTMRYSDSQGTATMVYNDLINQLPWPNRHLLLYILDFLALFSAHSEETRMTSANLAAVFHPEILSPTEEKLDIEEHRLSQDVLQYLIEQSDQFARVDLDVTGIVLN